jgi:hypothetical protein
MLENFVLVKSVFEAIPVYWHSLAHIPNGVLENIRRTCFNFLWKGRVEKGGYHLLKWQSLAGPKERGVGVSNIYIYLDWNIWLQKAYGTS